MYIALVPGDRVKVFDSSLFINDIKTPLSITMPSARVVCHYGFIKDTCGREAAKYPNVVDVIFDRTPNRVSKAHDADLIEIIT